MLNAVIAKVVVDLALDREFDYRIPSHLAPLVHVGYHKTGTNWLQEELFGDPRTGYRWLGKQPLTHPVHTLVRARPLDFDAAAVRAEFEPMLTDAERAGLLPVVSFPRLSGHPYSGGTLPPWVSLQP